MIEITEKILNEHCRQHLCSDCPYYDECPIWQYECETCHTRYKYKGVAEQCCSKEEIKKYGK